MMVTPDIRFIDYLFKRLWHTAADRQIASRNRLRALGALSESAVFYYRRCNTVVDLVYEECLAFLQGPSFCSEAAIILWLMFDYYKGKLESKKALKKPAMALCLETFEAALKGDNLFDCLSTLEFVVFSKIESKRVLYRQYSEKLLKVVTEKHPLYCTIAFNILMNLLKGDKKESTRVLSQCLPILSEVAEDAATPPTDQLNAIGAIMKHDLDALEHCFHRLFDFMEGDDISALFDAWTAIFRIDPRGLSPLKDMGRVFIERGLNIMADTNLEPGPRLKAIQFMMTIFTKNAYGFNVGEIRAKAYLQLVALVKTEQFLLIDYLETLRWYFKVVKPTESDKKALSVERPVVSANAV